MNIDMHESTPLLEQYSTQQQGREQEQVQDFSDEEETRLSIKPIPSSQSTPILALVATMLLIIDISEFLGLAPHMQIIEDIICQNYYASIGKRSDQISASMSDDGCCKIEPIQSRLAIIQGYKDTFDQLPGIFWGVVYGLLADSIGRRPVLLCGKLGLVLSGIWVKIGCWFPQTFSVNMVYLSPPILIFGLGGTSCFVDALCHARRLLS